MKKQLANKQALDDKKMYQTKATKINLDMVTMDEMRKSDAKFIRENK